ncbi:MAG: SDR family oxidoreductase [Verrucomicrobia bacterium]|nr:SDR family oxidoreductase [Verrucomicrobiota bacterium]
MSRVAQLDNKTIVIVGGTTGLGLAAAKAFVSEGARVVVVGRNADNVANAETALGQAARGLAGDATDPQTAPGAIDLAKREFGGFDGLYHVAGGSGRSIGDGPLHEISDAGWRQTIDLNLTSVFNSNRAALREWAALGQGGVILNMTSVLAGSPAPKHFATHAYATAKAGIVGLTKSAAAQYATYNIRVNAIAPALVATPMSGRAQADDEIMSFIKNKQPLDGGRIGVPEDLDGAAVFLMSDAAKFITGQLLAVDGGWSVSEGIG